MKAATKIDLVGKIREKLAYEKKFRLNGEYKNGFTGSESGPCCDKCRMEERHFTGRADAMKALVNCCDPFQIECQCHIPFRKVAVDSIIHAIEELLWTIERSK